MIDDGIRWWQTPKKSLREKERTTEDSFLCKNHVHFNYVRSLNEIETIRFNKNRSMLN